MTIGQVAELTGLSEPTLRAWERRFGFPTPIRGAGGQRRYSEAQVEQLRQIVRDREGGLSLEAAVGRATQDPTAAHTVFAALSERPETSAITIRKPQLTRLVQSVEDEVMATGARPLIIGSFQKERFYRQVERRWAELARTAVLTVARADFAELRTAHGVLEVPLGPAEPAAREWSLVCDGPGAAFALAAWELVGHGARSDAERSFELLWSAEAVSARRAARVAVDLAAEHAPDLPALAAPHLQGDPTREGPDFRRLAHLGNRVLAYISAA
jgi:DNA-binding transcriptional MerR regulator